MIEHDSQSPTVEAALLAAVLAFLCWFVFFEALLEGEAVLLALDVFASSGRSFASRGLAGLANCSALLVVSRTVTMSVLPLAVMVDWSVSAASKDMCTGGRTTT